MDCGLEYQNRFSPPSGGLSVTQLLLDDVQAGRSFIKDQIMVPFTQSAFVEPYRAVTSVINGATGRELFSQPTLRETAPAFLTNAWFWHTASSGAGMVLPYMVAGKLAGGTFRTVGAYMGAEGTTAAILKNEILAGVTGAALYDGIRVPRPGETRQGNVAGGIAAFTVFGAGNYWTGELTGVKKVLARAAVGVAGADAQLITSQLVSHGSLPTGEKLLQAAVAGSFMNNLLPPAQQFAEHLYVDTRLGLGLTVAADQFAAIKLSKAEQRAPDLVNYLQAHPWARTKYGEHNGLSTAGNGTISLWGRHAGAEELARGLQRLSDAKNKASEPLWEDVARLVREGKMDEAWQSFRNLRTVEEVRAHNAGQKVANQVNGKEVLSPETLKLEIGAWPAPGGVSFEYRWRQEFNQFTASNGSWRPGSSGPVRELYKPVEEGPVRESKPAEAEVQMQEAALGIVRELQADHHIAMVVGGAVRDRLRGAAARDYDITTSASPGQIKALFKSKGYEVLDTPYPFVQIVKINGVVYEIASFQGRRQGQNLSPSLYEDSALRDVTINSMAMDPTTNRVYDFFGGKHDLEAKLLRTLKEPDVTFATDIRTLMRIPRMLSTKFSDFHVSDSVHRAMAKHASNAERLPNEWVLRELRMIMASSHSERGMSLLQTSGVANHIKGPLAQALAETAAPPH